jgi:alkylhydroperoxidase family enzyme
LKALRTEQDPPFSAQERAVLQYARELTRTADARDTRDALNEFFSSEQIVEITLIVALANFTNRFNSGLEVQPEE